MTAGYAGFIKCCVTCTLFCLDNGQAVRKLAMLISVICRSQLEAGDVNDAWTRITQLGQPRNRCSSNSDSGRAASAAADNSNSNSNRGAAPASEVAGEAAAPRGPPQQQPAAAPTGLAPFDAQRAADFWSSKVRRVWLRIVRQCPALMPCRCVWWRRHDAGGLCKQEPSYAHMRAQVFVKTYRERRSWAAVLRAFYRVFSLQLVLLHLELAAAFAPGDWGVLSSAMLTHAWLAAAERLANWWMTRRPADPIAARQRRRAKAEARSRCGGLVAGTSGRTASLGAAGGLRALLGAGPLIMTWQML